MRPIQEIRAWKLNGFVMLAVHLALFALVIWLIYRGVQRSDLSSWRWVVPLLLLGGIGLNGFTLVQPNHGKVLIFFGRYAGSVRDAGFWWVNPLTLKKRISLRIHNFNSDKIKVNDLHGNPIEIGAVVVWRVVDTAKAMFEVEKYDEFVSLQSETAIRIMASSYPYDSHGDEPVSLRGNPHEIAEDLRRQVQSRLDVAGVEVIESRISHLAYAQEIAQAMLRRQQAQAIIAARKKIVEGAVGMVRDALESLSQQKVVELDEEKRATMVNNLMVALVCEREAQPVINTGTLYQ